MRTTPLKIIASCVVGLFVSGSLGFGAGPDGKIHISYWEKWSGEEELSMREVVEEFNESQNRIVVDFLSVGQIEQKTLLATAGGDPPDIAGVYLSDVCAFADRNALSPLTHFIREEGSTPAQFNSRYAKAYADMGTYEGEIWGVPSTPTTIAFYWNKDLFRAAGLDPGKPPRTIDELDALARKLTTYDAEGNLKQVGFLPQQQGWWMWTFPEWFGGQIFEDGKITIGSDPAALKAFAWVEHFSTEYGSDNVRHLTGTFGNALSPQDPFVRGQVAMIFDGVWRYNYMEQYAPGVDYGVAPWPAATPGVNDFTVADADMLVIPRGAKHPRAAWEFLKYVSSPNLAAQNIDQLSGVERLCFLQKKASPLTQWSPYFTSHHPNPYIGIFRQLAESPHAVTIPKMGTWGAYVRNLMLAFDEVRLGLETPQQALKHCQEQSDLDWQWNMQSLARRGKGAPTAASKP